MSIRDRARTGDPHVGKRRRTRGRSTTYALVTGIQRRTAAYRGTQDGTQHRIRHPGGTEYPVEYLAIWSLRRPPTSLRARLGLSAPWPSAGQANSGAAT